MLATRAHNRTPGARPPDLRIVGVERFESIGGDSKDFAKIALRILHMSGVVPPCVEARLHTPALIAGRIGPISGRNEIAAAGAVNIVGAFQIVGTVRAIEELVR